MMIQISKEELRVMLISLLADRHNEGGAYINQMVTDERRTVDAARSRLASIYLNSGGS